MSRLVLAVMLAFSWNAFAQTITGEVVSVADGDTITILEEQGTSKVQRKIRITGIGRLMATLAFRRRAVADCRGTDRYGRFLCLVRVNGIDVGLRQLETGMAWHYVKYAKTQPREEAIVYALSENRARSQRVGLWRDVGIVAQPVAPWDWRKG